MKTIKYFIPALVASLLALPAHAQEKPNDAQIAAIVVVANQADVDAGDYAAAQTADPEVKAFAERMVVDHSAVNKSAVVLVTKLNVTPETNATSTALKEEGEKNLSALRALKGAALDKAYIDHEVTYHEQVIQALDTVLIPNAQNSELKALLVKVRPVFLQHLEHARHLQAAHP
jgi:putative membrane protein